MSRVRAFTLSELAASTGAQRHGADLTIRSAGGLEESHEAMIAFVRSNADPKRVRASRATALILPLDYESEHPAILRHSNPRFVFARALGLLAEVDSPATGVHPKADVAEDAVVAATASIGPFAVIESGAQVGDGSVIGPHAVIGRRVIVGRDCRIDAHAVVYRDCKIGDRSILFSGSVVGGDGFGFEPHEGQIHRLPHIGHVEIGKDVEVGANSCVDRATTGLTSIGDQTKIDNLVMIGHNGKIGRGTMIAGQSGIAGSVDIGDGVILGGGCGIRDHIVIGDGARVGGHSGVGRDVAAGESVSGTPSRRHRDTLREMSALARLPELLGELRSLRAEIDALRSKGGTDPSG